MVPQCSCSIVNATVFSFKLHRTQTTYCHHEQTKRYKEILTLVTAVVAQGLTLSVWLSHNLTSCAGRSFLFLITYLCWLSVMLFFQSANNWISGWAEISLMYLAHNNDIYTVSKTHDLLKALQPSLIKSFSSLG